MQRGAPVGNTNATKGKPLTDALRRLMARAGEGDVSALNKVAQVTLNAALSGEQWAIREIWDRLEGKPVQGVELGGPGGEALVVRLDPVDGRL
jgi:hypothetical protein